jgi:cephalosporin hydroxylase
MNTEALQIITQHVLADVTYCGIPTRKLPLDTWIYQEIIWREKPDVVVELGSFMGGSALMFWHMLQHVSPIPRVITVDINLVVLPEYMDHKGITLIQGNAADLSIVNKVHELVAGNHAMVVEDSSHEYQNTLDVLRLYNDLVTMGDYFIVEDTICHHGLDVGPNPGPYEAVQQFLLENDKFAPDRTCEKFGLTYNPSGFLRRLK